MSKYDHCTYKTQYVFKLEQTPLPLYFYKPMKTERFLTNSKYTENIFNCFYYLYIYIYINTC